MHISSLGVQRKFRQTEHIFFPEMSHFGIHFVFAGVNFPFVSCVSVSLVG